MKQAMPLFEALEPRLLLSADITAVSSSLGDVRFISGIENSVSNTYQAQVAGTPTRVVFELGGETQEDTNPDYGWSAQFDMSSLDADSELTVKAYEGVDLLDEYNHAVDIITVPAWMNAADVEHSTSFSSDGGYSFDVFCEDLSEGFSTPSTWKWPSSEQPMAHFTEPIIDLADLRTGFQTGWSFTLESSRSGQVSARNFGYRLDADVLGHDVWEYTIPAGTASEVVIGPARGAYDIEFNPTFEDDLTWAGVGGEVNLDLQLNKEFQVPLGTVTATNVPFVGGFDWGLGLDVGVGFDGTLSAALESGNLGISSSTLSPDVTVGIGGFAEVELSVLAKAGLKVTGDLHQDFTATHDGDSWTVDAPGSLGVSGSLYWDTVVDEWDGEIGLFDIPVADWDFYSPPAEDPDLGSDPDESYDPPSVDLLGDLSKDENNPTDMEPDFTVVASASHGSGILENGYQFHLEVPDGGAWETYTSSPACSGAYGLTNLPDGLYRIRASAENAYGGLGFSGWSYVLVEAGPEEGNDFTGVSSGNWQDGDGDGDGVMEAGERVSFKVQLESDLNEGETVQNVDATLTTTDSDVEITQAHTYFDDFSGDQSRKCNRWLRLNLDFTGEHQSEFSLRVTYDKDGDDYYQVLPFPHPKQFLEQEDWKSFRFVQGDYLVGDSPDDQSTNNGDNKFQSGEKVHIRPKVQYTGAGQTTHVYVGLDYAGTNLDVTNDFDGYPDLDPGHSDYPDTDGFRVVAPRDVEGMFNIGGKAKCKEHDGTLDMLNTLQIEVEPAAWLGLDRTEWDFGFASEGQTASLQIQNFGTAPLEITGIDLGASGRLSWNQAEHSDFPWTLQPGEQHEIEVTLDVSDWQGPISETLTVQSAEGPSSRVLNDTFTVTGVVGNTVPVYSVPETAGGNAENPDASEDWIVWEESGDIFAYDYVASSAEAICAAPDWQGRPRISGNLMAWEDNRNGNVDIYACDLTAGTEGVPVLQSASKEELIGVDGSIIALKRGTNIGLYAFDTGEEIWFSTTGIEHADFGGGLLAFWQGNQLMKMEVPSVAEATVPSSIFEASQPSDVGPVSCNAGRIAWRAPSSIPRSVDVDTLQDTYYETYRNGNDQEDTSVRGDYSWLRVSGEGTAPDDDIEIGLIEFDFDQDENLREELSADGVSITTANLHVYRSGHSGDGEWLIELKRIESPWEEEEVSDANHPVLAMGDNEESETAFWGGANSKPIDPLWVQKMAEGDCYGIALYPQLTRNNGSEDVEIRRLSFTAKDNGAHPEQHAYLELAYETSPRDQWWVWEEGGGSAGQPITSDSSYAHGDPVLGDGFLTHVPDPKDDGVFSWYFASGGSYPDGEVQLAGLERETVWDRWRSDDHVVVWNNDHGIRYAFPYQPDLSVSDADIVFSAPHPYEGDSISVSVNVRNLGTETSPVGATAQLYHGDPRDGGTELDIPVGVPPLAGRGEAGDSAEVQFAGIVVPDNPLGEAIAQHDIYVQLSGLAGDNSVNNLAMGELTVSDNDTSGPDISDVLVSEHNGDGDGLVASDEQFRVSWDLADTSGIGPVSLWLDLDQDGLGSTGSRDPDDAVALDGNYYAISAPVAAGEYDFAIDATDADNSSETASYQGTFEVVLAERIGIAYDGAAVDASETVDLGSLRRGASQSEEFFLIQNNGEQVLALGELTVTAGLTKTDPTTSNVPDGGLTHFAVTPDTSVVGSFTSDVSVVSSDGPNDPFDLTASWEVWGIDLLALGSVGSDGNVLRVESETGGSGDCRDLGSLSWWHGESAFDETNGKLYVAGTPDGGEYSLYTLDVDTGAVTTQTLHAPGTQDLPAGLQPELVLSGMFGGNIIGFSWNTNDDSQHVLEVDPATGDVTSLGTVGDMQWWHRQAVLDETTGQLYVAGSPDGASYKLYTFDLATNVVTNQPALPEDELFVAGLDSIGSIVGLRWNGTGQQVCTVNPTNGEIENVGTVDGLATWHGKAVVDGETDTLYVSGMPADGTHTLYTFDLSTSDTTSQAMPAGCGVFLNHFMDGSAGGAGAGALSTSVQEASGILSASATGSLKPAAADDLVADQSHDRVDDPYQTTERSPDTAHDDPPAPLVTEPVSAVSVDVSPGDITFALQPVDPVESSALERDAELVPDPLAGSLLDHSLL